jgi:hypothetical protein
MKTKFLKMFRKRFTVQFRDPKLPPVMHPVTIIDHKLKTVEEVYSISHAVLHASFYILGLYTWSERSKTIRARQGRQRYYEACGRKTA